jgi:hypothetical protein
VSKDYEKTRRQVLRAGVVAVGGLVAVTARADEKLDPKLVQYQTTPKDGAKCSLCVNFEAPNACKIVSGSIDPNGWCVAFAPKES